MCPWTVRRKPAPTPLPRGLGPWGLRRASGVPTGATHHMGTELRGEPTPRSVAVPPPPLHPTRARAYPGHGRRRRNQGRAPSPAVWPFVKRPREGAVVLRGVDGSVPIDDDAD